GPLDDHLALELSPDARQEIERDLEALESPRPRLVLALAVEAEDSGDSLGGAPFGVEIPRRREPPSIGETKDARRREPGHSVHSLAERPHAKGHGDRSISARHEERAEPRVGFDRLAFELGRD